MRDCDCDACIRQAIALPACVHLDKILCSNTSLKKGDHLCRQDDRFQNVYLVLDGVLKAYRISPAGKEQVLRFTYPGELLWTGGKRTVSVVSIGASRVCSMSFMTLQRLMREYPEVQIHCYALLSRMIVEEEKFLRILSHGDADRRLAFFLLELRRRLNQEREGQYQFRLPMSRVEIGNYLGLRMETIVRIFHKLERDHMIALCGRDVTIVDVPRLQGLATGTRHRHVGTNSSQGQSVAMDWPVAREVVSSMS